MERALRSQGQQCRCHCKERSDKAIPLPVGRLLSPRFARDVRFARHDRMGQEIASLHSQ